MLIGERALRAPGPVHLADRVPAQGRLRQPKYKRVGGCTPLKADGYAHHPYDFRHAPDYQYPGVDNVTIGTLSRLTKALDKLRKVGALRTNNGSRMPLYLTEYGYFATGHRACRRSSARATSSRRTRSP